MLEAGLASPAAYPTPLDVGAQLDQHYPGADGHVQPPTHQEYPLPLVQSVLQLGLRHHDPVLGAHQLSSCPPTDPGSSSDPAAATESKASVETAFNVSPHEESDLLELTMNIAVDVGCRTSTAPVVETGLGGPTVVEQEEDTAK